MNENKLIATEYKDFFACFLFQGNNINELFLDRNRDVNLNDIYVGRVSTVKNDIQGCFVDIASNEKGYLPFEEIYPFFLINREYDGRLKQGDLVLVQVTKDKIKSKEYGLSMKITIPGKFSVVTADDKSVHYSGKLSGSVIKEMRKSFDGIKSEYGFVIRTNAQFASVEDISSEIYKNTLVLDNLVKTFKTRSLYSRLYKGHGSLYNRIASLNQNMFSEILTDSATLFDELKELGNVRMYSDEKMPLKTLYSFDKAFLLATSKKVNLRSGGYIIIEPTEALTVIDVNTGKFDKKLSKEDMIRLVNKEACLEVCRQCKLRNLSGIIIIDFINSTNKDDIGELVDLLKGELKKDIVKANFVDVTGLSLVEITREKKYSSIYDLIK